MADLNYAGGVTGGLSGAAAGAAIGSAFPGVGTAIGAGAGGLIGAGAGLFSGSKDRTKNFSNLLPEQKAYLENILQQLMGGQAGQNYGQANDYISQMLSGSPEAYQRFAAPYETQFQEQTLPGIAERFAGLGGGQGGALSSSGFAQALGGAATQHRSNLAGLYAQLQQQAAQQAFGQYNALAGYGLGTSAFQPTYQPGSTGFGGNLSAGILSGVGNAVGQSAGQGLSSKFSEMFKPQQAAGTGTPPVAPVTP